MLPFTQPTVNPATLVLSAAILLLATFAGPLAAAAPSARPLFAPDLSNAEFKPGSWAWEGGDLVARGVQPWAGGLGNIWTKASYRDMPRSGRIGLQYHGQPLRFRNLTVEAR